jgi:ABC-type Zn2+ transport system substrate-binding protein/surface adhesin
LASTFPGTTASANVTTSAMTFADASVALSITPLELMISAMRGRA